MTRSESRPLCLALVLVAAALVGCGVESGPPRAGVVVGVGGESRVDPGDRLGPAGRLDLHRLGDGAPGPRPIAPDLVTVGAPAVAWDGRRLLFAGRRETSAPTSLWVASLPGGAVEPLEIGSLDCGSADELPDGRIVFSARTSDPAPTPELASGWALFVLAPETGAVERITFGLGEIDPTVLGDGRILYAGWQPAGDGRPAGGGFALFTVHPDGTGVSAFHGFHGGPRWKLRPVELGSGDVVYLGGDDVLELRPFLIDHRAPAEPAAELDGPHGGVRAVARGPGASVLVLTGEGQLLTSPTLEPLPVDTGSSPATSVAGAFPRSRPQGHLSMVDPAGERGQIFAVDARWPGHVEAARSLRVRAAPPGGGERILGIVELAADGSFFVDLPANTPLLFDLLDVDGRPVEVSTTPLWVRPNEKRGCVGCHERPGIAPPNRRPLAVLGEPTDLTGGPG